MSPITALFQEEGEPDPELDERKIFSTYSILAKNFENNLAKLGSDNMLNITRNCILRVFHKNLRVKAENVDPQSIWNAGVQMVAQCIGSMDKHVLLGQGKFAANGGITNGYV